jgi:glycosyltransferase involved in cell wall biosynthesis
MIEAPSETRPGSVRVVRVFSRLNIGGPAVHVILLSAGLRPLGYQTRLVVGTESPREGNMLPLAAEKGVVCERLSGLGREIAPLRDLRALMGLHRLFRMWRPSVVHTHTAKAGLLGRLAARWAGVPVIVHTYHGHVLRGYFSPTTTAVFRWLEARLASLADSLVVVSESVKQDLADLGVAPASKIRVIPLGLDLAHLSGALPRGTLRREMGIGDETPLVGMVGRLVPIKDVPTFLEAARLVRESGLDARFALIGDGEARPALEGVCLRLGLARAVSFLGWRADLAAVYGDLDVVVNSSLNEGTPVALIEALAAGRPVVATRVGGTPDLLGDEARGRLVPPAEPARLSAAIIETLREAEVARRRAQAGRAYVLERHSVERLVRDVDSLYRELLATKKVAGSPAG